jgi:TetR/AcrR family transcriptional repressor of bet genes
MPDSTVDRTLAATLACISEQGIAAASTHAIAERAGLNQGNIHYHFRSKDQLLLRLLEVLYENSRENIQELAESDLAPRAKLEAIVDLGLDLISRRRDEFVALIAYWAHAMCAGPAWRRAYRRTFENFRTAVKAIIRDGEARGDFKSGSAEMASVILVGIIQGVGLQCAMAPDQVELDTARLWCKELLDSLLPAPPQSRAAAQ